MVHRALSLAMTFVLLYGDPRWFIHKCFLFDRDLKSWTPRQRNVKYRPPMPSTSPVHLGSTKSRRETRDRSSAIFWLAHCVRQKKALMFIFLRFSLFQRDQIYVTGMFVEYLTWFYKTVDHCDVIVTCHLMICFILVQIGIHVYGIKSLQCMSCIVK